MVHTVSGQPTAAPFQNKKELERIEQTGKGQNPITSVPSSTLLNQNKTSSHSPDNCSVFTRRVFPANQASVSDTTESGKPALSNDGSIDNRGAAEALLLSQDQITGNEGKGILKQANRLRETLEGPYHKWQSLSLALSLALCHLDDFNDFDDFDDSDDYDSHSRSLPMALACDSFAIMPGLYSEVCEFLKNPLIESGLPAEDIDNIRFLQNQQLAQDSDPDDPTFLRLFLDEVCHSPTLNPKYPGMANIFHIDPDGNPIVNNPQGHRFFSNNGSVSKGKNLRAFVQCILRAMARHYGKSDGEMAKPPRKNNPNDDANNTEAKNFAVLMQRIQRKQVTTTCDTTEQLAQLIMEKLSSTAGDEAALPKPETSFPRDHDDKTITAMLAEYQAIKSEVASQLPNFPDLNGTDSNSRFIESVAITCFYGLYGEPGSDKNEERVEVVKLQLSEEQEDERLVSPWT